MNNLKKLNERRKKLKILLVVHQFFPHFSAGTEVLTLSVAQELRRRGHDVHIVAGHPCGNDLADSEMWVRDKYDEFVVERFCSCNVKSRAQGSIIERASDNLLAAENFARLLVTFKPDWVHYFHFDRLGTGLILEAERAGIRQSYTPTDFWAICPFSQLRLPNGRNCGGPSWNAGNCALHFAQSPSRFGFVRLIARIFPVELAGAIMSIAELDQFANYSVLAEMRALSGRASKTISRLNRLQYVVAPNGFMRSKLLEFGLRPEILVDSTYGVELPVADFRRIDIAAAARPLRVGFIGTLAPHKGVHVLLDAFVQLPRGVCSLRIYGDPREFPDYSAKLAQQAADHSDIDFAGTFAHYAIFDVLANFDVLVVPSLWYENTPLVVYSAQAAGKIIVASDCPGISAVVRHDWDGLLFPPGDSAALSRLLFRLASEPELRKGLSLRVPTPRSTASYVDDLLQLWDD